MSFSATNTLAYTLAGLASDQLMTPDAQYGELRSYDFNGDGRDDLAFEVTTGSSPTFTVSTYELISNGSAFTASVVTSALASGYSPAFFVNFNDDACTDYVYNGKLYVSGCNGSIPTSTTVGTVVAAMDWDGDGRTDLVIANGSVLGVYLSTGSGLSTLQTTTIPYVASCQYVTMDANGDGLDDLGCYSQTSPEPITYYAHNGHSDLAISFADGYGVTYAPSYVSITSPGIYTKGTSATFPNADFTPPYYVVSSYTSSDGIGGTYSTSYTYAGAIENLQGRGFQGFTTVTSADSRTGFKDTRTYATVFPNTGLLTAETVTQSTGTDVSVGSFTLATLTLDPTGNNERYFPYTAASSVNTHEVQVGGSYNGQLITTTAMNYGTPDIYGNFSSVEKTITDEDSGSPYFGEQWTTTTATTISASPSTWCNSLPTERDVTNTAPGVPTITRHVTYPLSDYTNCRQTEQVIESGNPAYQVDTKYAYNPSDLGNLTGKTVTGVGMVARTTTIAWGPTGQFPATITNALNQSSQTTFDSNTGQIASAQDPNGTTVSFQYDPFGRLLKEIHPDGTYNLYSYNDCVTWGAGAVCMVRTHWLRHVIFIVQLASCSVTAQTGLTSSIGRSQVIP